MMSLFAANRGEWDAANPPRRIFETCMIYKVIVGFESYANAICASKQLSGNLVEADLGRPQDQLPNCLPSASKEAMEQYNGVATSHDPGVVQAWHTWGINYKDWSGVAQQMGLCSNNVQRSTGLREERQRPALRLLVRLTSSAVFGCLVLGRA